LSATALTSETANQPREALTIARIVRVNHAGEHGAIRIYRAQIAVARRLYPEIAILLEEMLGHEIEHCARFRAAMPARQARPCRAMFLWGSGGYGLGLATALLGRRAVWICTAAVEETVHRHLDEQLVYLAGKDEALRSIIAAIHVEELAHLDRAIASSGERKRGDAILRGVIALVTECLIWLSTWGDSTRLKRLMVTEKLQAGS
jgi:3-demethoxyubiquinol 3-hydroxylase